MAHIEDRTGEDSTTVKLTTKKKKLLWMLTPTQREIALLICETMR